MSPACPGTHHTKDVHADEHIPTKEVHELFGDAEDSSEPGEDWDSDDEEAAFLVYVAELKEKQAEQEAKSVTCHQANAFE
jgi:hypothetical protein